MSNAAEREVLILTASGINSNTIIIKSCVELGEGSLCSVEPFKYNINDNWMNIGTVAL